MTSPPPQAPWWPSSAPVLGDLALRGRDFRLAETWMVLQAVMAIISMIWGNLVALVQSYIRRLMACSVIAHIGYTLLGVLAASRAGAELEGAAAAIYYVVVYSFANLAAWGVIVLVGWRTGSDRIEDYAGLARRSPFLAFDLLIASLAGSRPGRSSWASSACSALWEARPTWWWIVYGIVNSDLAVLLLESSSPSTSGQGRSPCLPWRFRAVCWSAWPSSWSWGSVPVDPIYRRCRRAGPAGTH